MTTPAHARSELKAVPEAPVATILVLGECPEIGCINGCAEEGTCSVVATSDEAVAAAQLRSTGVDVLVAHHRGRGQDAVEFLMRARALAPATSRILLCDQVDLDLLQAAGAAGVLRLLVRPFRDAELLEALQTGIDRTRLARHQTPQILPCGESDQLETGCARTLARHVLPALPRAILTLDAKGRVVQANASAELILGRSAARLHGCLASDLGMPCREAQIREGVMEGSPDLCGSRDVSPVSSWGEQRQILWSCQACRGSAGEHTGCEVSFLDITDRSELDLNIFLAKHEIESIFDSITDPTFLVDQERRIVRANRALSRFVAKPFPEILGYRCGEVLAGRGGGRLRSGLKQVFGHGRRGREDLDLGDGRVYKLHYFPIVRACRVRHVVVRYHEITAEKEMENRLLQAEKLASIGELSAGIAHEINNPVGFISWNINQLASYMSEFKDLCAQTRAFAQRSLAGEVSPIDAWRQCVAMWDASDLPFAMQDANDIVQECNQGVERVQNIVRDLRSYSHPATTEWQTTDIHECLESALTIAASEIKHRCDIVREYGEIEPIRAVSQRLMQVFINLLVNAAQAVPERGKITLRTKPTPEGVQVEVEDTGNGIPQEIIHKIFDPFFTTKGVGEGTGLGLYLTRSIIEEHRGQIHATSQPGAGTCFTVSLPFDPDQGEPHSATAAE